MQINDLANYDRQLPLGAAESLVIGISTACGSFAALLTRREAFQSDDLSRLSRCAER